MIKSMFALITIAIVLSGCQSDTVPIEIESLENDCVTVKSAILGEYPTRIESIKISDLETGKTIWSAKVPLDKNVTMTFVLCKGVNPRIPEANVSGDRNDVVFSTADGMDFFTLTPGKEYEIMIAGKGWRKPGYAYLMFEDSFDESNSN